MTVSLALCQLEIEPDEVARNLERALQRIEEAAANGADVVALPELFDAGYFAFDAYPRVAQGLEGARLGELADAAADHGIWLLSGSVVEDLSASAESGVDVPATDGYANTAVLFDPSGTRQLVYRKHHLFGYESAETRLLTPGERIDTADVGGFTVGVTTCYDLRFPELYRELVDLGATLVLVPSAWPYPRVEHWKTLSRARAVENLAYVATINGSGEFEEATLLGRSAVYNPWGTTVAAAGDEPATVTADVDPRRVREIREEFPSLRDRRR
ncbi:carbon-nitrogen family hydrolase [Halalkaliarchaeum sp. AArc-GB]|uniref:carbon-nitrogen family hydrolase n=1 Tax=Halalkaliarchaeum sp. AArc-GB TaxID=3074078 RepID=UPI00285BB8A0|nr:carbon-nitrogen family hydrolase [Halalkaliarchaeum sp. AArc-GB]MDR5671759.1 carbon-nitrogen family hydrolase [Halalkaliarchaeum sp. AArc-GB]